MHPPREAAEPRRMSESRTAQACHAQVYAVLDATASLNAALAAASLNAALAAATSLYVS